MVGPAREAGFFVYEVDFTKKNSFRVGLQLFRIVRQHRIQIINTHSSLDSWLGGIVGKLTRRKVIRTRHLSTPIRRGMNSKLLYNWLPDTVITTCQRTADILKEQAGLPSCRCLSIPTGVDPSKIDVDPQEVAKFRQ